MPTLRDAPLLWLLCALIAAYIGLCLRLGRLYGRGTPVRRDEQPAPFWGGIAGMGAVLVGMLFLALLASAPWPPGAETWVAPHTQKNGSWATPSP